MFAMKFAEIQIMIMTLENILVKMATLVVETDVTQIAKLKMVSTVLVGQQHLQILVMKNAEMIMT